jgi:hypothetical protein
LQTKHLTTSSRHPACNAQAEVANKTIAKYLNSFVDDTTLDWEIYLAPLMFCYNTSFHRSIKNTPYFLTYGQEPRLPNLPTPDLRRKFYGESSSAELYQTMMFARDTARRYNEEASDNYKSYYDKKPPLTTTKSINWCYWMSTAFWDLTRNSPLNGQGPIASQRSKMKQMWSCY